MPAINLGPISKQVNRYMMDEVTIRRPTKGAVDPVTLLISKTFVEIYSGIAFIVPEGTPYSTSLGGEITSDTRFEIAIPADADPIDPNDEVTCDTSVYNEQMEGMVFIVVGQIESTFLTHRRLTCFKKEDAS